MNQPIRVLCVFSTLDRGGAESMCMNLYREIDRDKVQFDFIKHTEKTGAFEEEIKALGGKIYSAPRYQIYNHLSYVSWWHNFLRNHLEYRIIHGHFFTISSIYFAVAQKEGRKTIGHSHCTDNPKDQIDRPLVHKLGNIMISHIEDYADYAMACSRDAGAWVFKKIPFTILNNAIDSEKFQANPQIAEKVRAEFELGNSFVLGNVSRFNLQKNPRGTLEIFRLVHEKRPDSKLLWIGDGPMREEVKAKSVECGIQDDIVFTGVRSDVNELLQAMDVFIFPSYYEGLGVAAVEAQAAGIQTYCSSVIPKEVAVTDLCNFLPLENYNQWAEVISQIPAYIPHEKTTERIKKAGYDIYETAKWLQDFYLSIN